MASISKFADQIQGRRGWRWILVACLVLLLVVLLLCVAVPWWAKGAGAQLASQALGRSVTINAVSVSPWRLGLALEGLRVVGATDSAEPLLEVERVEVGLSLRSLAVASPVLEHLSISRPVLRLGYLGPGRYDIDDLLARFAKSKPAQPEKEAPSKLALYNIRLHDGQVLLDDRVQRRQHRLSDLSLALPFVSTLPADVTVHVQPQLSGRINGVPFGGQGQALPFAERPEAQLDVQLQGFDLAPYIAYLPRELPLRLTQGRVDASLALQFQQAKAQVPVLSVKGTLGLSQFALQTPQGEPWLAWRNLQIELRDVQPLRRQVHLGAIQWQAPELCLNKDAQGQLWMPVTASAEPVPQTPKAGQTAARAAAPLPATPWQLSLANLALSEGRVSWRDASLAQPVLLSVQDLRTRLGALSWPLKSSTSLEWALALRSEGGEVKAARGPKPLSQVARLSGQGSLSPEVASLDWQLEGLDLQILAPYIRPVTPARVQGQLATRGQLQLKQPLLAHPLQRLSLGLRDVELRSLSVGASSDAEALLKLERLGLDQIDLDLGAERVVAGQLSLARPFLSLKRDIKGETNVLALLPARPEPGVEAAAGPSTGPSEATHKSGQGSWSARLKGLQLTQGLVHVSDAAAPGAPVAFKLEQLGLTLGDLAWPSSRGVTPASLSLRLGPWAGGGKSKAKRDSPAQASLQWQGQARLQPLGASGRLRLDRFPLHLAQGYLDPRLGLHLQQLELGLRSQFDLSVLPAGVQGQASGDVLLADLKLQQLRRVNGEFVVGEDLLDWQAMKLNGFKLAMQPGQAPQLSVDEASLSDFYARIIINEAGQINLRELGAAEPKAKADEAVRTAPAANSPLALGPLAVDKPSGPSRERQGDAPVAQASQAAAPLAPLKIRVAQSLLEKGRVDFTDRFVRPNYSARLSELRGRLGAVSSDSAEMANLSLQGRVAGTGLLDISGKLNPLGKPLALDLTASATDIELAPLSTYAAKYIGYGLERGKFSSKLQYKIEPNGSLTASNQIILNQLTFGEKVESPDATQLPVLFAVSLLKDKNGVIDIELPISGSINDPQFSIGGLVWKLIVNLFSKAISSPFSLFAGKEGADLNRIAFVPGSARLRAPEQLDQVAKMLMERPGLALTITAWADPVAERDALKQRWLEEALLAERKREVQRQRTGATLTSTQEEAPDLQALSEAERVRLLKRVYEASKLPNKPRNFLGLAKDIPAGEMRSLLLASHEPSEDRVRQLALERGVGVRDALIAKGLPNGRLFLGAPRLVRPQDAAGVAPAAAQSEASTEPWAPFADMKLSSH